MRSCLRLGVRFKNDKRTGIVIARLDIERPPNPPSCQIDPRRRFPSSDAQRHPKSSYPFGKTHRQGRSPILPPASEVSPNEFANGRKVPARQNDEPQHRKRQ